MRLSVERPAKSTQSDDGALIDLLEESSQSFAWGMQDMTIRWSRIAVFAVSFFVALLPAQAQAPSEAHTVPAGQSVALVTGSTGPIAVTSDAKRGKTSISETAATPKQFTLLYTAPETETAFTETVIFTNPTAHSAEVTVVRAMGPSINMLSNRCSCCSCCPCSWSPGWR